MTYIIDASAIEFIDNYKFIEFSNNDGPIEVGPVTSNNLNFNMRWTKPDTAKQCHANAKIIYDKMRSNEDALIASDEMIKKNGLSMIRLDYINTNVNDFAGKPESLEIFESAIDMPPKSSTELSGYFVPTSSGQYKFTLTTEGLIWVGDVACYEYLPENATVGEITLTAGRYYYVRFQAKNETTTIKSMDITIMYNNKTVSNQKFVHFTNGYIRKLLYYGLVKSEISDPTYYCYFNNYDNYDTILNYKGINMIQKSKIISSDYNAPPKLDTISFAENETAKLNVNYDVYEMTILSATYGTTKPHTVTEPVTNTVPETDTKLLNEPYTFTETRDVPTQKTRNVPQSYMEKVPYKDSKVECYQQKTTQSCASPVCTDNIIGYQQKQGPITGYKQKEVCSKGSWNWNKARFNQNCKMENDLSNPNYGPNVNDLSNPIYGPKNCAKPVCKDVVPAPVCTTTQFTNYRDETRTRNIPESYMENVPTTFSENRSRSKVPVPTKKITEMVPRTIDPVQIDVTEIVRSNIAGGFQVNNKIFGKDPAPGQAKTLTIKYSTKLKDFAKTDKQISINDKCEVIASYASVNLSGAIFAPSCSEKMVRLNNDGTVSVSGSIWIQNPLTKEEQTKLVRNVQWIIDEIPDILNVGTPLSKLVSQNGFYMVEFSASQGLIYNYCLETVFTDTDNEKTKGTTSNKSLFLYRPSYSELGGKKFVQNQKKELIRIPKNYPNLVFSKFNTITDGVPTSFNSYSTFNGGNCEKICGESITCSNYVTGPNNTCYIDTNTDTTPIYTSMPEKSGYNIYTKQYNMDTTDGPKPFVTQTTRMYSEYNFISDQIPNQEGFQTNNITRNLTGITELLNQHKKLSEGFSDLHSGIPARFSNTLPAAPDTSVEEGRIEDLQEITFQQNMMYSIGSIAAASFLLGAIVLARN